jgi:heme transport system ATP-binding protein
MIAAHDIVFRAAGRAILQGVSASFEPGRLHLIIGPNGAGKSTFVKVLSRLLGPSEGRVLYGGQDIARATERELATRRAVLSQAVEIAFPLTVGEVVMMGRYPHFDGRPAPVDRDICTEVMQRFDVEDLAERSYPTLSGGERQRVNFARVLAQVWRPVGQACRYLFLDEPLTFLDIRHQMEFMRMIAAFTAAPDIVTVGVVHDLALAARFADQLVLLDEGRVRAAGARDEVLTPEHIRAAFQVEPIFLDDPRGRGRHIVYD